MAMAAMSATTSALHGTGYGGAFVIRMRLKPCRKSSSSSPSYYSMYTSKIIPTATATAAAATPMDSVRINIVHEAGGAKAPYLMFEGGGADGP